ncbi:MAG: peptidylprolyl isomerase [Alphaproteobacteria bacterium]
MVRKFLVTAGFVASLLSSPACLAQEKPEGDFKIPDSAKPETIDFNTVKPGTVVGQVGNKSIAIEEVFQAMQALPPEIRQGLPIELLFQTTLEQLIQMKIIESEMLKKKAELLKEPEVKEALEAAQNQILLGFFTEEHVIGPVATKKAIRAKYREFTNEFPKDTDQAKIRLIVLKTEDDAKAVHAQLKSGADFLKLAREKSIQKETAKRDGEIGFINVLEKEKLLPGFDIIFKKNGKKYAVPTGSFTDPIKTDLGWCILKVDERKEFKAPKLAQMKEMLKAQLSQEALTKFTEARTKKMAVKRIHPNTGKPMRPIEEQLKALQDVLKTQIEKEGKKKEAEPSS